MILNEGALRLLVCDCLAEDGWVVRYPEIAVDIFQDVKIVGVHLLVPVAFGNDAFTIGDEGPRRIEFQRVVPEFCRRKQIIGKTDFYLVLIIPDLDFWDAIQLKPKNITFKRPLRLDLVLVARKGTVQGVEYDYTVIVNIDMAFSFDRIDYRVVVSVKIEIYRIFPAVLDHKQEDDDVHEGYSGHDCEKDKEKSLVLAVFEITDCPVELHGCLGKIQGKEHKKQDEECREKYEDQICHREILFIDSRHPDLVEIVSEFICDQCFSPQ